MSVLDQLRNLLEEPPPTFAFELGPNGIAHWQAGQTRFDPLTEDIHTDAAVLAGAISKITPAPGPNRRRAAALILPDRAARVTLMDFDQFPRKVEDQTALIRFRLKRTVPFDIETAILRYAAKSRGGNKVELIVAAIAVETLAPYETAFHQAGFHPGYITVAALSAANLAAPDALSIRLSGMSLTICHFQNSELKLHRYLELQTASFEEILNVLDPTLAYLEDERKTKPAEVDLCGFGPLQEELAAHLKDNWSLESQPLRSRHGSVNENNAGLYGYLAAMGVN